MTTAEREARSKRLGMTTANARWLVAVAVVATLAGACTRDRAVEPGPAPVTPGPAPAGTVRVGYPAEPPTLNPVAPAGASRATRDVLRPVQPSLFRLDARLRPQPELAERMPRPRDITQDPFTVKIRLREASWSDGTPITSADVRFTWERLREGPTGVRYRFLTDVQAPEPRTVVLVFDRPVLRWWAAFSVDDPILPAHAFGDGSEFERAVPVAGGPFLVEGWTPGLSIRLRRNPGYFGTPAMVEAIEVLFVPNDEMRLQLFERGELDLLVAEGDAGMGDRSRARGAPSAEGALDAPAGASGVWGPTWWELDLDLERLKDSRRALADAFALTLDRSLFAEVLEDSGQLMDGIPARFPAPGPRDEEGLPALAGPWRGVGPDAAAARQSLEEAGFRRRGDRLTTARGEDVEVVLAYPKSSLTASAMARLIHFRMREVGLRVEIVAVDIDRLESEWIPNRLADAFLVIRRGADAPDAAGYRSDASPLLNPSRVGSADAAIDEAETLGAELAEGPATGLHAAAWTRAQRELAASRGVLPLVRVRSWIVSRGGITGPAATGALPGPFWNAEVWRVVG